MKTLKEQILEIFEKYTDYLSEGERRLIFGCFNACVCEIESLIKENYVEKEFVRWLYYDCPEISALHDLSLADLKIYWLNNIKDNENNTE